VKLSAGFSVRQTWALIDAHAPEATSSKIFGDKGVLQWA
jgi:hypothetical protein